MLTHYLRRLFSHKLMLSNLPLSSSASEVTAVFAKLSLPYKTLAVPESPDTRSVKGYAVMEFAKGDECLAAKEALEKIMIKGKVLKVVMMKGSDNQVELARPLLKHRDANE